MDENEQTELEELEIRASNMETIIQAAQIELNAILARIKKLTTRRPIGFIIPNKKWKKNWGE